MRGTNMASLWKLERAQTRLRMSRSQVGFWCRLTVLTWVLGTVVYFVVGIGAVGRLRLWVWLWSSFWAAVWPAKLVFYAGQYYYAGQFAPWLTASVYGQPVSAWVWESLRWGTLPAVALVVALFVWLHWRSEAEQAGGQHVRGVQLLDGKELQKKLWGFRWWQRWLGARPAEPGAVIAGVELPRALESSHIAVVGATGTGKSMVLRSVLQQIAARGESAVVVDPEREFVPEFYRPERGDVILNPFDARCPYWSPWLELAEPGDAEALAKSLLPDPPEVGGGSELYFRESARQLFVSVLDRLASKDPHDIPAMLYSDAKALTTLVAGTPAASLIEASAPGQRSGIISTLQLAVKAFTFLPPSAERRWSARAWEQDRQGWLFLTFRTGNRTAVLPLTSLWLDAIVRRLLDTDLHQAQAERVWLVIDELAALQRQPHLEELLMRGRKHGVAAVVGFQAMTQLRTLYGRDTTATMLAAPATKLLLRSGEPETAEWCSRALGRREVIRPQASETAGPANARDAVGLVYQRREEAVVLASEIQQLPSRTGYLCVAGYGVAPVAIALEPGVVRQPEFLARAGAGPPTIPPAPPAEARTGTVPPRQPLSAEPPNPPPVAAQTATASPPPATVAGSQDDTARAAVQRDVLRPARKL